MIPWYVDTHVDHGTGTDLNRQNWSKLRKTVNFTLACSFVFFTFALINAGYIPYAQLTTQLGFTFENFTTTTALSFTGFALSSVFILPFIHKCGRRWIYLLGSILQFTAAIWLSQMNSPGEMMGAYTLAGMGGGLSEALLQITIVDLFFVHQRATMSGFFLLANTGGSGLGPLAGGYIVTGQSWRWMFRWAAIFLGINLLLVLFFFEESKYIPSFLGRSPRDQARGGPGRQQQQERLSGDERQEEAADTQSHPMRPTIDSSIKRTTIRQRLALFTVTDTPVLPHLYQPFVILFTFPAVAYTAITYGALTTWYTVLVTVAQPALVYPPYNFQASGVGLFIFSVSIGCGLGCLIGAPLNDKSVIWFAARNGGIHEPETRLYMALIAALPALAGIFMVGLGLAHVGLPHPVSFGLFVQKLQFFLFLPSSSPFQLTRSAGTTVASPCRWTRHLWLLLGHHW